MTKRSRQGLPRWRLWTCTLLSLGWLGFVQVRVLELQVAGAQQYRDRADSQQQDTFAIAARRGRIVDRHHEPLAISVERGSIYADPRVVEDPEGAAGELAELLSRPAAEIERLLRADHNTVFLWRKAPLGVARRAATVDRGVTYTTEHQRVYPRGRLAVHALGFVGVDNEGLAGLEYALDDIIGGEEGLILAVEDAFGDRVARKPVRPGIPGRDLVLTLDEVVQYVAQRELERGVRAAGAKAGIAIVLEPDTGAVLALASYPDFDPNRFAAASDEQYQNRAVHVCYEPGSIFKIVTAASALEHGAVALEETVPTHRGRLSVGRREIRDVAHHGALSFADVLAESSNVGMVEVVRRLEPRALMDTLTRFGFGRRTGIEIRGEAPGILHPVERWKPDTLVSLAMGYEICVTPLQMAAATAALGAGGVLHPPHLVRAVVGPDGRSASRPVREPRQAVPAGVARDVLRAMVGVVEHGTGTAARLPGYTVAGKTGTAKTLGADGRYRDDALVASFVGLAPAEAPAVAVVVMIDEPTQGVWGGEVAAPVFASIALPVLRHLGIPSQERIFEVRYRNPPEAVPDGWTGLPVRTTVASLRGEVTP